jgi:hypothetical protein
LRSPAAYRLDPVLEALKGAVAYNVGHAYARLSDDLRSGERTVPDFAHAMRRHATIEGILHAAGEPWASRGA